MDVPTLAGIHLHGGEGLQKQLYQQLLGLISRGEWPAGTRLPPSRQIARELGVSRNTVTAALAQLQAEGFLDSRRGSGVFVHRRMPALTGKVGALQWQAQGGLPPLSDYGREMAAPDDNQGHPARPFTLGLPDLEAFPRTTWARIQRRHADRSALMGYDSYQGYAPLRRVLADYLRVSRQVRCEPDQILVTHGAQQAISLVAQVLLNEGDHVLVEDPGYSRARQAFRSRRAQLDTVPVDERGLLAAALPAHSQARLMYVTPTHHYPLGGIMAAHERLKLLDWAASHNTWLIEDDYDSEFHFHGKPIASLQGMAEQTPVIYLGSFSKTLFPALRLGYLVLPSPLVAPFIAAKSHSDGESPLLTQATVADFIEEGHFVRHLRRMRQHYEQKWDHLALLVERELAGLARPVAESAGMHLVLRIDNIDDVALVSRFASAGFGGTALSSYYAGDEAPSGIALGFANTSESQRIQGIHTLAQLIKDMQTV